MIFSNRTTTIPIENKYNYLGNFQYNDYYIIAYSILYTHKHSIIYIKTLLNLYFSKNYYTVVYIIYIDFKFRLHV